jgi:hypothetical protein
MLRFTERAAQALERSDAAARRFNPAVRVRLAPDHDRGVRADLVDRPEPGDRSLDVPDGPQVFVDASLTGTVDAGEHDLLTLLIDR